MWLDRKKSRGDLLSLDIECLAKVHLLSRFSITNAINYAFKFLYPSGMNISSINDHYVLFNGNLGCGIHGSNLHNAIGWVVRCEIYRSGKSLSLTKGALWFFYFN